jgi:chemosensory pili system protein ChpA (sensor histidine kinase/response regulator)
LLGRQEIVIKPLGSFKSLDRSSFGGATIDPEGRVVLCWILLDCWRERHKLLRYQVVVRRDGSGGLDVPYAETRSRERRSSGFY